MLWTGKQGSLEASPWAVSLWGTSDGRSNRPPGVLPAPRGCRGLTYSGILPLRPTALSHPIKPLSTRRVCTVALPQTLWAPSAVLTERRFCSWTYLPFCFHITFVSPAGSDFRWQPWSSEAAERFPPLCGRIMKLLLLP